MPTQNITPRQLRTLQTLFGMYARKCSMPADGEGRCERLAWASHQLGHEIGSFKELRGAEAAQLIDTIKGALGQEVKPPRLPRAAAMARGSHGRRGRKPKVEILATPEALEEVDRLRERVEMTREGFTTWLGSRHSPLCGRAEPKLLTISDCNRVRWALKAMLRRAVEDGGAAMVEEVSAVAQQAR